MPVPPQSLAATLDRVITRRLALSLPTCVHPPPPHDARAEQIVVAGVIEGSIPASAVADLDPGDIYVEQYRWLLSAAAELWALGVTPTDARLAHVLDGLGVAVPVLGEELAVLREATPTCLRPQGYIRAIRHAARRRRALARAERACGLMRLPDADDEEIVSLLVDAADELGGEQR